MSGVLPHEHYMRRAIELGKQNPRLPFGALIVDRVTGEILAEGWNRTEINPIWHGEIDAINRLVEPAPPSTGRNSSSTPRPSPVPCARVPSSGQASKRWSSEARSVFSRAEDGRRSTSRQKRSFAARHSVDAP